MLYLRTGRRAAVLLGVTLLSLAAVGAYTLLHGTTAAVLSRLTARRVPIYRVETPERKVAISFDATWGTTYTDRLLDILDRHQVKTTFFLAGQWVRKYPDYVKKIAARGHELGNHSWTHPHMNQLSPGEIREELMLLHQRVKELTGQEPFLFRPPFGEYSDKVINVAESLGYKTIQWSVDSLDWRDLSADQMIDRILRQLQPGDIVLFHNQGLHTADAVDRLIPLLRERGYQIVPVSQIILRDNYYVEEHTGTQRPLPGPGRPGRPAAPAPGAPHPVPQPPHEGARPQGVPAR